MMLSTGCTKPFALAQQLSMSLYFPDHLASYAEVLIWAMRTSRAVPFKNGQFLL